MNVKIAEGYVEVTSRTNASKTEKQAEESGKNYGNRFSRAFSRRLQRNTSRTIGLFGRGFGKAGEEAGDELGEKTGKAATRRLDRFSARFYKKGQESGEEYGKGFFTAADGRLRDARGRFVSSFGIGAEKQGKKTGSGFIGGMMGSVKGGMSEMSGLVTGGFSKMSKSPYLLVAAVAAAMAALPALGAAAGTALALGFGGAIAGVGIFAAAQSERVKTAFGDLKDKVVEDMQTMAKPLRGTLVDVAGDLESVFDKLSPHLESAFEKMAPVLSKFSGQLFSSFEGGSVIDSATGAFNALLTDLGPKLKPAFQEMGAALNDLFATIKENPAVFNGLITGALSLVTGTIKLVNWLSQLYVWIQTKLPGGMLTLIAPFTGLLLHFTEAQGKTGSLVDKLKMMGNAFTTAGSFIKSGLMAAFEKLKPMITDIQNALASSDVMEKVSKWWTQISEIIKLGGELIGVIFRRVADIIMGIWNSMGTNIIGIFSGLWTAVSGILTGAFEVIKGIFNVFIGILTGDWARAWTGIKQIVAGIWNAIIAILKGAWKIIVNVVKGIVNGIVALFKWLWKLLVGNSIIPDMVNGIIKWFRNLWKKGVQLFTNLKNWVVARVKAMRDLALAYVNYLRTRALYFFTRLRIGALKIWNQIKSWIVSRAKSLRDTVVNTFNNLRSRVVNAFEKAKDGVKRAWGKLKGVAKAPVKFVINTVYNRGIVGVWNKIARKVKGLGTIDEFHPKGFAKGGITDARKGATFSGFSQKDDQLAAVRSGEGVLVPEAVKSLGPQFVHKANRLKGRAGKMLMDGLPGFKRGGIVGMVSDFGSKLKEGFKGGFKKVIESTLNPLKDQFKGKFGSGKNFSGMPFHILKTLVSKSMSHLMPFGKDLEGGKGVKAVPKIAEKYIGNFGGTDYNNKFTRAFGMPGQPWCAMFVSEIIKEAKAQKAYNNTRSAAVATFNSRMRSVPHSSRRTGDLASYRGSGHINILKDKNTTIGGNESNRVRKQHGYVNSATAILRPGRYAKGGIVEEQKKFANLVLQDRANNRGAGQIPADLMALQDVVSKPPWSRGSGTHDGGGVIPDGTAAINRSGQAEMMATLEEMRGLVQAGSGKHYHFEAGSIVIDGSKLKSIQDLMDMIEDLQQTARQFGG